METLLREPLTPSRYPPRGIYAEGVRHTTTGGVYSEESFFEFQSGLYPCSGLT